MRNNQPTHTLQIYVVIGCLFFSIKFFLQYFSNLFNGFTLKIGSALQLINSKFQDTATGITTDFLEFINNPGFNFIAEFIQINVKFIADFFILTVNINFITC